MPGTPSLVASELFPLHRGVFPHAGELLSSYLLRLAFAHSADHYRFYSALLPRRQIWNRDVDRGFPDNLASLLVERCSLTPAVVESMTLRPYEQAIASGWQKPTMGTATWINPIGICHRTRTLHGLQACPKCLAERTVYQRCWRLSFVTWCAVHSVALVCACPGCGSPIVPHRQMPGTNICHRCHVDWMRRAADQDQRPSGSMPRAQATLLAALELGSDIPTQRGGIPIQDLARGISLLRRWKMIRLPENLRGVGIEAQSLAVRQTYFDAVHELITGWPGTSEQLSVKGKISKQVFERAVPPAWLSSLGSQLSSCQRVRTCRLSKLTLSAWLRQQSIARSPGWRTRRAEALAKAVQDR